MISILSFFIATHVQTMDLDQPRENANFNSILHVRPFTLLQVRHICRYIFFFEKGFICRYSISYAQLIDKSLQSISNQLQSLQSKIDLQDLMSDHFNLRSQIKFYNFRSSLVPFYFHFYTFLNIYFIIQLNLI